MPICNSLGVYETSFEKSGWPKQTVRLTPAAGRSVRADEHEPESHHVVRCPLCGTLYRYGASYEYLVNGIEDTEESTCLTPDETRVMALMHGSGRRRSADTPVRRAQFRVGGHVVRL